MTDHAAAYDSHPSFADRAAEQLRTWPALEVRDAGHDVTVRLPASTAQVARLRQPDEADLCLTWPVIQRLGGALTAGYRVRVEPGSDWIRVRLHGSSDVRMVVSLVSVAIQAHTPHQPAP